MFYLCIDKIINMYLTTVEINYRKNRIKVLEDRIKDLCDILMRDKDAQNMNKKAIIDFIGKYEEEIKYLKFMNNITLWEN